MKKTLLILLILSFFANMELVGANIMCNDGTESPTCTTCHQGCCSWHGGCASSSSRYSSKSNDSYDSEDDNSDTIISSILIALFVGCPIYSTVHNNSTKQKK